MKLYGKELDEELAKRNQAREERISKRIGMREAAKQRGISASDLLAYERGEDVCPHLEYEDMLGGVPMPKLIFKRCNKCGKVDETSMEKVNDKNLEKTYEIMKKIAEKMEKEKLNLEKK